MEWKAQSIGEIERFFSVEWTLFTWPGELDLLAIVPRSYYLAS